MEIRALSYAQMRETAKLFNAASGNLTKAAHAASLSRSTFQSRVNTSKAKYPDLFKEFDTAKGGAAALSDELATDAWLAFQSHGNNQAAAAKSLGLPEKTFAGRLKAYSRAHKIDLTQFKPAEPTLDERVAQHRDSEIQQSARAKLKDSLRVITALEDRIKELEWGAKASFQPADWALPTHTAKKREHMPYLLTSDFQVGEVIRQEETEYGSGYNSSIFRSRYRRMIDTTIYLSFQHGGRGWTYPGIIYARGGDTISGGIHEELRETDDLTPVEACEAVFEEEAAGILKLAEAFGRVEVKTPGAAGNHDRNTFKGHSKKASAHSYDRLIAFMLRNYFNKDKRVTFQTSESFDVYFPIYGKNILLTHGDRMGSSGGQGFIGPAATILRGVQKVMMEQAAIGRHVDRVDHGHFHFPMITDFSCSNGCLPGYSEYAKQFRMRPSPPIQTLLYHHPKRGVVDIKQINLEGK